MSIETMTQSEPEQIAERDPRLVQITWTAEEYRTTSGAILEPGQPVVKRRAVSYGEWNIGIPEPHPVAMYLSIAKQLGTRGHNFMDKHLAASCVPLSSGGLHLVDDAESLFFDALQDLAACVILSFTALEAFANAETPDRFRFTEQTKKGRKTYSKSEIERRLSLDTKLNKVLPQALEVRSPAGIAIWQPYRRLVTLRNDLVHLKSKDWKPESLAQPVPGLDNDPAYIFSRLLHEDVPKSPECVLDLMEHFVPDDKPRWLRKIRDLILST